MSKRDDYDHNDAAVVETLRSVSSKTAEAAPKKSDDEKLSIFWRVFGGTIISVAALAAITLYNTVSSGISEVRAENSRLKEEVATQRAKADDNRREIDSLKERISKHRQDLDAERKEQATATDAVKKDLTAVEKDLQKALTEVREKIARIEGQQTPMKPMEK